MSAMAFLAGMGAGYLGQKQKNKETERQDKLDKQQEELHAAKMAEIKRDTDSRDELKVAAAPADVREMQGPQPEAAYVGLEPGQEPKPLGYIAGNGASARGFAEKGIADASAVEQNKPEAWRTRMADLAMQGNTYASNALDVEDKQVKRGRETTTFDQAQIDRVNTLKKEGVFDAAAAMRRGDVAGFEGAFNKTGDYKASNTTVTQEIMDVGGQKVPTFTYTFDLQMPDGTVKRETRNSHTTSMALMPYEKLLERGDKDRDFELRKKEAESTADYRKRTLGIQGAQESRAAALHKIVMEEAKVPAAVKLQATSIAEQIKTNNAALAKSMAESQYNPENPGTIELLESQARLNSKYKALLAGYTPETKAKPIKNPFKLNGSQAAPTQAQAAATPAAVAQQGVKPAINASNTKVLSEAAPIKSWSGMGAAETAYNIQLPDGTTKVVPVSELQQMGFPINSKQGKLVYDPTYNTMPGKAQ